MNTEMLNLKCGRTWQAILVSAIVIASAQVGISQTVSMTTMTGLNTAQPIVGATATPDPTIGVGTIEFCEHVNSSYQCWYKSGADAFQPVNFIGGTNPKSDAAIWSQHSNNNGNTSHCPTADTPNGQILHDNVYDRWILQKRISASNGHSYMCVAVSNGEDMSQPTFGWFAFEYDLDNVIPQNAQGNFLFPDYPQAGLWQTKSGVKAGSDQTLWITYDLQDPNNGYNINGVLLCAVDYAGIRASIISPYTNKSHTPACVVAHPLVPFNQRRSWVPANNSDSIPPISSDGEMFTYAIEPPRDGKTYLTNATQTQGVERWTINWTATPPTPTFVASWNLRATNSGGDEMACFNPLNYYYTQCIPQPSTATTGITIDSVGDRMQQPFSYSSNGGHGSTWTSARAIQIDPDGIPYGQTEADVRILQWSTSVPAAISIMADHPVTDPLDPSAYVFLPSVARDRAGNIQGILGTSGRGASEHPALGSFNIAAGTSLISTHGYIASPVTDGDAEDKDPQNYRWGDWFNAVLDPSDSCTVWVVGEYLAADRTTEPYWYTEIAQLPPMAGCI